MRGSMKAPAVTELFQQKMVYNIHLRKLQKIRQDRRHQLTFDSSRSQHQREILSAKSRSFAHRYNKQHQQITQHNVQLLHKLEKVRPFTQQSRSFSYQHEDEGRRSTTPLKKQLEAQTQKENSRLYCRMRSVSSTLGKDRLMKDYAKSQQIKNRISRYATNQNKVTLKSEQFVASKASVRPIDGKRSSSGSSNVSSHYRAREILQNRVDNRIKAVKNSRDSAVGKGVCLEEQGDERVFATEVEKLRSQKKKIFI